MASARATSFVMASILASACQAGPTAGPVCTRNADCSAPLVCRLGRCRSECASQRDCPAGARCFLDADRLGACSVAADVCTETAQCGGLACIDGQCDNPCTSVVDCAPGSICESTGSRARCVRPADDAGVSDGGGIDGGPGVCTPNHRALAIACGLDHSCAIRDDHVVVCWGLNLSGQLGDGDVAPRTHELCGPDECSTAPVAVLAADGTPLHATLIAAGLSFACAVEQTSGAVVCWGDLQVRGASPGTMLGRATPVLDAGGHPVNGATSPIVELRGGREAAYARHADGTIEGWGVGTDSQLGLDTSTFLIEELSGPSVTAITAGRNFVCATAAGAMSCIGDSIAGVFGGAIGIDVRTTTPVPLDAFDPVTAFAAGAVHLCALVNGNATCLGADGAFELGDSIPGAPCSCSQTPIIAGGTSSPHFDAVFGGPNARISCAASGADLYCWGDDAAGQTGQPASTATAMPTRVSGLGAVPLDVSAGDDTTCAVLADHRLMCWGANDRGQLGIGVRDVATHDVPATVCLDLPTD